MRFPPHAQHAYSDLAYQWLGEIVTRASGTPYPEYVREAILRPLGLTATAFRRCPACRARCATGYDWRGCPDDLDGMPSNLVVPLLFHSPDPPPAGSLREMHKPRYLADDQWTQAWGISWCGTRQDEVTWIGHSGGIPGRRCRCRSRLAPAAGNLRPVSPGRLAVTARMAGREAHVHDAEAPGCRAGPRHRVPPIQRRARRSRKGPQRPTSRHGNHPKSYHQPHLPPYNISIQWLRHPTQ